MCPGCLDVREGPTHASPTLFRIRDHPAPQTLVQFRISVYSFQNCWVGPHQCSDLLVWGGVWASGCIKSSQVILTCSQGWEPLAYRSPGEFLGPGTHYLSWEPPCFGGEFRVRISSTVHLIQNSQNSESSYHPHHGSVVHLSGCPFPARPASSGSLP